MKGGGRWEIVGRTKGIGRERGEKRAVAIGGIGAFCVSHKILKAGPPQSPPHRAKEPRPTSNLRSPAGRAKKFIIALRCLMSTSTGTHTDGDLPYKSEATTAADIPAETDDLVVVPALSSQLEEPIGTIVVKSVFDTTFPHRLKGIVDSDSFLVRQSQGTRVLKAYRAL